MTKILAKNIQLQVAPVTRERPLWTSV